MKRNKWLRDKYDIHDNPDTLDGARHSRNKNSEEITETTNNERKSFSFRSKKQKNKEQSDFDEALERRNSKRLRESIRKKYNLPTGE